MMLNPSQSAVPVITSLSCSVMSEPFEWSFPAGSVLCRDILRGTLFDFHLHDWQVEGVCQSLDGMDLLAITPTGSRKTSFYIMYILVVCAVLKDSSLCPTAKFPKNACLIVICPTIPLQLEMVSGLWISRRQTDVIWCTGIKKKC